ncbi:MAG: SMP-30/gluconolactonase/LRE family protein [Saprospiraceae bacterium]|nr:SMP-30/gluconolactonase/LRE family protein [Saprospiraceae bacterium]
MFRPCLILLLCLCLFQCRTTEEGAVQRIEIYDPGLEELLSSETPVEILARGFAWAEGPVWVPEANMLLFSDVPANKIYQWSERDGLAQYLAPSGYTGADTLQEGGSNGLLLDASGQLILCQHGDRRVAVMDGPVSDPVPQFRTMADRYNGRRLNSPNDLAALPDGLIYFTDPPYGLDRQDDDPAKELPYAGVYRITDSNQVELLIDTLTRPNGIAFSPDFQVMYVAQSDPAKAWWVRFRLEHGVPVEDALLYDASEEAASESGLPDGLKVHPSGRIFATGPGGVWIFSPEGNVLGKIRTAQASANCAFDAGYRHLYITSDSLLLRVAMRSMEKSDR